MARDWVNIVNTLVSSFLDLINAGFAANSNHITIGINNKDDYYCYNFAIRKLHYNAASHQIMYYLRLEPSVFVCV